jgi:hypothetical protein
MDTTTPTQTSRLPEAPTPTGSGAGATPPASGGTAAPGPGGTAAPAQTLADFWTGEKTRLEAIAVAAAAALEALKKPLLEAARKRVDDAGKALAQREKEAATIRQSLPDDAAPGDVEQAAKALEQALIALHQAAGELRAANADLAALSAKGQDLQGQVTRATAATADAGGKASAAEAAAATQSKWKEAVLGPLKDLPTDAKAILTKEGNEAKTQWLSAIPDALVTLAEKRLAVARQRIAGLRTLVEHAEEGAATSEGGALASLRLQHRRAEARLGDYVKDGKARLDALRTTLQGVAKATPITATEKTKLVDLGKEAADAATIDNARTELLGTVYEKEIALATAKLDAQAKTPLGDVTSDPGVKTAQTALDEAVKKFDDKNKELTAPLKEKLLRWAAQIPDAAWQTILDYEDAVAALMNWPKPDVLVSDLTNAEKALVAALASDAPNLGAAAFWTGALATRTQESTAAETDRRAALISALRGDR